MGKNETKAAFDTAADANEVARFDRMADDWWDEDGPMRPLHRMNPLRVGYVRAQAARLKGSEEAAALKGLSVLDVGCGAGLLAEPLTRLGADVIGIDPSAAAIGAARRHANAVGLTIDYRAAASGDLIADGLTFDLVTALEVIEHTPDPEAFVHDLGRLLRPDGLLVLSTLNRTAQSFVKAIVGAEYLLGWLPKGTHDWKRFLKPSETARLLRAHGLTLVDLAGITYDPAADRFSLGRARDTNYILAAHKG